jgi:NitT/TauT family transport system permease protein
MANTTGRGDEKPSPLATNTEETAPVVEKPIIAGGRGSDALRVGDIGPRQKRRNEAGPLLRLFLPNRAVSTSTMGLLILVEAAIALTIWLFSPFKVLPRPMETLNALRDLWMTQGLGPELFVSLKLNLYALSITALLSLVLSYLTVVPLFRPIVAAISKGRFLSLTGFTLIFTLMVGGGFPLKVSLLVFGVAVFYITSMASVIAAIPKEAFDHARTLRMKEWQVVWEVVILGTADKAFEVLRQNAAIGWMMLTMVEGIVRGEGGIGAMLLNSNKHFILAEVFAIQLVILLTGLVQDYVIGAARRFFCPYADLVLERKGA